MKSSLWIIVRQDLKLSKGKMAVQAAHAAVSVMNMDSELSLNEWLIDPTITIFSVNSLSELLKCRDKCIELEIPYSLIRDAGKTHLDPGTTTCLGCFGTEKLKEILDKLITPL
ncbi:MAG: peptidyl-tRNA hydrolase [Candidatus Hermodarchaeota archaeon]